MKTDWDYSKLARSYLKRADYSAEAIEKVFALVNSARKSLSICDVGAGTGNLTKLMVDKGHTIVAVEPNDEMRKLGIANTSSFKEVTWTEGVGEQTGQPDSAFDVVTFGSSFNVTDRRATLVEVKRILKPGGWFVCMWNHRDLEDPLQQQIEAVIHQHVPSYTYGTRREDQTEVIRSSELFHEPVPIEGVILYTQSKEDCVEAWRSHATLARQSEERFSSVISDIEHVINQTGLQEITIPYKTRVWVAQLLEQEERGEVREREAERV